MSSKTVTTQAELDAALASGVGSIIIDSPRGVWQTVWAYGSATGKPATKGSAA